MKQLFRACEAAKILGITEGAFMRRKYPVAEIKDGRKLYDVDKLVFVRKPRSDKGKSKNQ